MSNKGYNKVPLGDVLKEVYRYPTYYGIDYTAQGVLEIRGEFLNSNGSISVVNPRYISNETNSRFPKTQLEKDDIVMSVRGTLGKVGIITDDLAGANITANLLRLSPDKDLISGKYLLYYFLSSAFNNSLENASESTTIKTIKVPELKGIKIPLPSLKEQRKIAEILSSVDAAIEKTEQVIAKTEEVKKGLMQQLLTKGIGHKDFKQTEIGEIPVEWSFLSLKEMLSKNIILDHLDGNHGSLYPKSSEFTEDGVPYVSANMILDSKIDFTKSKFLPLERASKFKKGIAKNGDILFAHNATVGPLALLETNLDYVILSTTLTYYRPNLEVLHNKFLMYYMQSNQFVKQYTKVMGQSTRNQVPITAQREFYFVLPPLKEQLEIVAKINNIDIKLSTEKAYIDNLINLKQGLMQQLLTGQTRVKID